jgi:tetratricopeptide (TPR) repeat protein
VTDWFRNTAWNEAVEREFNERLNRARRKEQYLRIQASTLASSHPEVTLNLLDRYFRMPDDFEHAQAHVDRATALLALGRIREAIESYEAALAREAEFPNLKTQACLDLPYLVATLGIREQYDRALQLLQTHAACLLFPVDQFRWHAAQAFIAADQRDRLGAKTHAGRALEAAGCDDSGFRYHPKVGLVGENYNAIIRQLKAYNAA